MKLFKVLALLFILFLASPNSWALPPIKMQKDANLPSILKADEIDGDTANKIITASGNVEVSKGSSVIFADKMIYNKNGKKIRAIGNVKIKNLEIGNMTASEAEVSDDLSSGQFLNSKIFFSDGSYLFSNKINRESSSVTTLQNSVYSFCPNNEIKANESLAGSFSDFASFKSKTTTIDREKELIKIREGVLRFFNVPVFYTPFIQFSLPSKKRHSGFLPPSYTKTTNFGLGLKIPYYFNIAPNIELTVTPHLHFSNDQVLIDNQFRHFTSYGKYEFDFEGANNRVNNSKSFKVGTNVSFGNNSSNGTTNLIRNTSFVDHNNSRYRWNLSGNGKFDFTQNTGLDFKLNTVSDGSYLRDYHFSYLPYTISKANLDYINRRDYFALKSFRIQELENKSVERSAPFILPSFDAHIESKPFFSKERLIFSSNITSIYRNSGLQYRRASLIPEAKVPFNLGGNLFEFDVKVQGDLYSLENNFKDSQPTNNFSSTQSNLKQEASLGWRLPLMKKSNSKILMIEPMANFVTSAYKKRFGLLPNEDSSNSELTISNLFVADRIPGFDRNEAGNRASYGLKSSLFNDFGEFGLTAGQSYRITNKSQDVAIRGFAGNNKSNFVGQAIYRAKRYFSLAYSFQLNESTYLNDVNQLTGNLNLDRFNFSADYLFIRRNLQISQQRQQVNISSKVKLDNSWSAQIVLNRDLILQRNLSRGITLFRDGCCTVFGFSIIETNPSNLAKPQKTFNLTFSFKNL